MNDLSHKTPLLFVRKLKRLTAETAEYAEKNPNNRRFSKSFPKHYFNFSLGVLCKLCGEIVFTILSGPEAFF